MKSEIVKVESTHTDTHQREKKRETGAIIPPPPPSFHTISFLHNNFIPGEKKSRRAHEHI